MKVTRREFIRGGVAAFTVSFAAPAFLSDLARAQGASRRNLVVLYLSGGNDALSTLIPVHRQLLLQPSPDDCRAGGQRAAGRHGQLGRPLGLHPRLTGLRQIFDAGHLALIQRTGYPNSSRSHFLGTDIWSTADPAQARRRRLARTLPRHAAVAGRSAGRLVHDSAKCRTRSSATRSACRRFRIRRYAFSESEPRHGRTSRRSPGRR